MFTVTVLEYKNIDTYEVIVDTDDIEIDTMTIYCNSKQEADWVAYGASEVLTMLYGSDNVEVNND